MVRKIIRIDEGACTGCGLCADACHEGAIAMVNGKAKLLRDDFCDGLGDCLPACPAGAIAFEEREAADYDQAAVLAKKQVGMRAHGMAFPPAGGCPGSRSRRLAPAADAPAPAAGACPSQLRQWPVQIKLAPVNAPWLQGADLLICADCAAYACGSFHRDYMRGKITLIGCPKLDEGDYAEKLTEIIRQNEIRSVTVVRMEVPCCGGIQRAVETALQSSGKFLPWQVVTLSVDGGVLE